MRPWRAVLWTLLVLCCLGIDGGGGGGQPTVSCPDTGGNHLNFSGGAWTCGSSSSGGAPGNAKADGVTKGIVTFPAADFTDNGSGLVSLQTTLGGHTFSNTNTYVLRDDRVTLQDDADTSKQAQFQLSGISAGNTRVFTLPNFNGTLATLAGTETLTGKTISGASNTVTNLPETALAFTDVPTANATAAAHGLLPKLPGNTTTFLRGDGTWATPAGGGGGSSAFDAITSGVNITATMQVGSGASLSAINTGTIVATSVPLTGVTAGTAVGQAYLIGNGSTLAPTGTGTITATTAGALTSDPLPCGTNRFATDIAANGTLTCTQPSSSMLSDAANVLTNTSTHIVENKQNVLREVPYTPSGSPLAITPNCDTTDVVIVNAIAGDLQINDPICTGGNPRPSQEIDFRLFSSASRGLTFGSSYSNEAGVDFPTATTGDSVTYDYFKVRRNSATSKWDLIALKLKGKGVTLVASGLNLPCDAGVSAQCVMRNTAIAGTGITIPNPGGSPADGQLMMWVLRCTAAQTIGYGSKFIDSPNVTRPTACSTHTQQYTVVGARYSLFDDTWQTIAVN